MVWKVMTVQKVMRRIFRLQTTGTQGISRVLKIMSKSLRIKMIETPRNLFVNLLVFYSDLSQIRFDNCIF